MQRWWDDPAWRASRRGARADVSVGSYWSSPDYRRLCTATNGLASRDLTTLLGLGVDWAEVFHFIPHSVGVGVMRTEDTSLDARADVAQAMPVFITCGPKQPAHMDCVLAPLAKELLQAYGARRFDAQCMFC